MEALAEPRPTCGRRIWSRGEDRRCGQTVALLTWADTSGAIHHACPAHVEGMKRRYPESLLTVAPNRGRLSLSTPWSRGLFGPNDRIAVENEIPEGWEVGVSVSAHRSWVILWLIDPAGTERVRWTNRPTRLALASVMELAKLAQTLEAEGPAPEVLVAS